MDQLKVLEMELKHFIDERDYTRKLIKESKSEKESIKLRQRMLMIMEIIKVKEERLSNYKGE